MRWSGATMLMAILVTALPVIAGDTPLVYPVATLRFATACADCHEGDCSERLSFARRPAAAGARIRQYAGEVDDALAHELYAALERMKTECRYAPLPWADRRDGFDATALVAFRDSWNGAYFVPFGERAAGRYRLSGRLTGSGRIRIGVIDTVFDPWVDSCLIPPAGRFDVEFATDSPQRLYARLRPRGDQRVTSLRLDGLP